jgi:hypothetical protein
MYCSSVGFVQTRCYYAFCVITMRIVDVVVVIVVVVVVIVVVDVVVA